MFKKNLIYTLVLAAFFGIYSLSAFQKEPNGFTIFICIMCITVIAFIWYMPWNHRRMMKKGIDQSETPLDFVMTVYETGVKIEQENGACTMKFGEIVNKIAETEESFLLFAGKERLFVLPKRFVQDEDALRARFQNAVGEKYLTR